MNSGFEIAKTYWDGGLNCLPIVPKRKCPSCDWQVFTEQRITLGELEALFKHAIGNGPGLCVVCGEVSGNLEIVDIDIPTLVEPFLEKLRQLPCFDLLVLERTPRGGLHVVYRCDVIEHSQDLAKGPDPDKPEKMQGWIHTRGEGSICLIAPTSSYYHDMENPTGDYRLVQGSWTEVHTIEKEERNLIIDAARSFNKAPAKEVSTAPVDYLPAMSYASSEFLKTMTWAYLLVEAGWRELQTVDSVTYWQRPGKEGSGHSATTGYMGRDMFFNFSNNAPPFEPSKGYSKFSVFALLKCDGDRSSAGKILHQAACNANRKGKYKVHAKDPDLDKATGRAWAALLKSNEKNKRYFRLGGVPVRLETTDLGRPIFHSIGQSEMIHETAKVIWWYTVRQQKKKELEGDAEPEWLENQCRPDREIVANMLATPDKELPIVTRIVDTPVYGPDGAISLSPGYHSASMTYCRPPKNLSLSELNVEGGDITEARKLLEEIVCDFPFASEADRCNALSLAILPLVREMIDGPVPLYVCDAPTPGSGKGLLVDSLLRITQGKWIGSMQLTKQEAEVRKAITASMIAGSNVMMYDNVRVTINSAALSSALTQEVWKDRFLGESKMLSFPIRCLWVATGNNIDSSTEIARRCCWIRLNPEMERPWERTGFKHARLREWVDAERVGLLKACYTLIGHWVALGKPMGSLVVGNYESWAAVMSGIMNVCGYKGFMKNVQEVYDEVDVERENKLAFLDAWYQSWPVTPKTSTDLYQRAVDAGFVDKWTSTQSFGKQLRGMKDTQIGPYMVHPWKLDGSSRRLWKLTKLDAGRPEPKPETKGITDVEFNKLL